MLVSNIGWQVQSGGGGACKLESHAKTRSRSFNQATSTQWLASPGPQSNLRPESEHEPCRFLYHPACLPGPGHACSRMGPLMGPKHACWGRNPGGTVRAGWALHQTGPLAMTSDERALRLRKRGFSRPSPLEGRKCNGRGSRVHGDRSRGPSGPAEIIQYNIKYIKYIW
jgi:hypothetical protein